MDLVWMVSGVAGALADALSMGSSGYLAAKSEAEVHAHQIEMERHEMRLMPDLEEQELALIYEAKGLPPDRPMTNCRRSLGSGSSAPPNSPDTRLRLSVAVRSASLRAV